jgi:hypothetical protein
MKQNVRFLLCLLAIFSGLIFGVAQLAAEDKPLTVEKIVTATRVEQREPVGESKEFEATAGKVFCWTKIKAQTPPAQIKHVWYAAGKLVFSQTLDLKNPSNRTWSWKNIHPGDWKVEVTDEGGTVLSSIEFKVK